MSALRRVARTLLAIIMGGAVGFVVLMSLIVPVVAHPANSGGLYVAESGQDQNDCRDPNLPCRTITYALAQAGKGDKILVAAGRYTVGQIEVDAILGGLVEIQGGYRLADRFTWQDPDINLTYLEGAESDDRAALADHGFIVVQDVKGWLASLAFWRDAPLTAKVQGSTLCQGGRAGQYACDGLDLLSQVALTEFSTGPTSANDIWGFVDLNDQREYAIIGLSNGTAVVDVTNPENPQEVGTIAGARAIWRDIKVYQFFNPTQARWNSYAYVTVDIPDSGDANPDHRGLQIIDLTALPESISLAAVYHGFTMAHNIYIGEVDYTTGVTLTGSTAYAYILGSNKSFGAYHILDLTNPITPVEVTPPQSPDYAHDATTLVITDSRTSACAAGHNPCHVLVDYHAISVDLWDVTDKSSPFKLSSATYDTAGYVHSGWWSADKQYLFIQDEGDEYDGFSPNFPPISTTLRTLDISDLANPFISNVWTGTTTARDHNGFTKGNRYYMSNYQRGLTILDITNPNDPQEVAFFDTYPPGDKAPYAGAWGVYPYLPSGTIIVSDLQQGLFLLREGPSRPDTIVYIPVIIK